MADRRAPTRRSTIGPSIGWARGSNDDRPDLLVVDGRACIAEVTRLVGLASVTVRRPHDPSDRSLPLPASGTRRGHRARAAVARPVRDPTSPARPHGLHRAAVPVRAADVRTDGPAAERSVCRRRDAW